MSKKLKAVFVKTNQPNLNGRIYPKEVMDEAMKQFNEKLESHGIVFGELGIKDTPSISMDNISHKVLSISESEENENHYVAEIETLETPKGQYLESLIEEGKQVNLVNSGLGKVDENGVVSEYKMVSVNATTEETSIPKDEE